MLFIFLMIPLAIVGIILIALIGALITGQEGFASALFFLLGLFLFIYVPFRYKSKIQLNSLPVVLFPIFILLGAILDQTGNKIYNYPIVLKECQKDEVLTRKIAHSSSNGKSSNSIEFYAVNSKTGQERQIHWWTIIWIRSLEYLALGLILILLQRLLWNYFYKGKLTVDGKVIGEVETQEESSDDVFIQLKNNQRIKITIKKK